MQKKSRLSSAQTIILGFTLVIAVGTLLLMLPVSSREESASFIESLFTATSSTCVTGLVVKDTVTNWSLFGQIVILAMIQIGGMGAITVMMFFMALAGRRLSLSQRSTVQEALAVHSIGGVSNLVRFVIKLSISIEIIGAALMYPVFVGEVGYLKGIWYSIFHSVSAFCNAGFDLMGNKGEFSSFTTLAANPVINIIVMLLIIIGGIGFLTWEDLKKNKFSFRKYRMQSKVILCVTALLIFLPAIYFFFFEFENEPFGKRVLVSLFQSVTTRTAGFNTADLTKVSDSGQLIMIVLMLIGGAPGSTAGGMKVTTAVVLLATAVATFKKRDSARLFSRRLFDNTVKNAIAVFIMYVTMFLGGAAIISRIESIPLLTCLFETASAVGTVGLTLGITSGLGLVSRIILILLMFFGRVGGLTLVFAALAGDKTELKLPAEKIMVG